MWNINGIWQVSTSDDSKEVNYLGVYEGKIDDIAFHLSNQAGYSLDFKKIKSIRPGNSTCDNVHISVDSIEKIEDYKALFTGRETIIEESGFYKCVKLSRERTLEEKQKIALDKLSEVDKEVLESLGLNVKHKD